MSFTVFPSVLNLRAKYKLFASAFQVPILKFPIVYFSTSKSAKDLNISTLPDSLKPNLPDSGEVLKHYLFSQDIT